MMSTKPNAYDKDPRQCLSTGFLGLSTSGGIFQHQREPKDEVQDVLVEGMNRLTFYELQREQDDLHGVAEDTAERSPEVNRLLVDLDEHLKKSKAGTAYEIAEKHNLAYVSSRRFRMLFLRATRYDPQVSANQLIAYFDVKRELFGKEKLAREITLSDLDEDDVDCLLNGSSLVSNFKDRAGRCV